MCEGELGEGENSKLNIARHAFSCNMRCVWCESGGGGGGGIFVTSSNKCFEHAWMSFLCFDGALLLRNRFKNMTTEWLALWAHFLWSVALTMLCCVTVWWKVGHIADAAKGTTHTRKNESTALRRKLLNIAGMVSVCLILNVIAALSTSANLQEWSRTADMSLTCEIKETWNSRSWDVYGFG
jgi:hypothetical protein